MPQDPVRQLIQAHLARYPELRISDVYKLLHQATFGSSEAVSKRASAQEWLQHELKINPPDPQEDLLESVSPDGSLVRLHLRAYQARGGKMKPLLDAVIRSAETAQTGRPELMAGRWAIFAGMVEEGVFDPEAIPPREVYLFGKVYAARNWAVVAHSPHFIRTYHPAYRVLTRDEAEKLCKGQGIAVSF
jgi:hypothetical protein